MSDEQKLALRPIGRVVKGQPSPGEGDPGQRREAEVEIDPIWVQALDGIEEFSHIWVLWWADGYDQPPERRKVRPERREEMPLVGIFATRSPHRPNPLALTAVRLLERKGGRLRVQGLDARVGTPVLDLKPYLRRGDLIPEATTPGWLERLWQIHDGEKEQP